MEDALRLAVLLILLNIGLVAYFHAMRAFFPRRVARTRALADRMPGRAIAAGLINLLFFGVISFLLFAVSQASAGNQGIVALATLALFFFLSLIGIGLSFGLAGVAELVGERLAPAQTAFRRTLWGTLAISMGSSLPFVGWFLLLPYASALGLGAFILSFFWREPATLESSPAPRT
jgi:hypothetical protein